MLFKLRLGLIIYFVWEVSVSSFHVVSNFRKLTKATIRHSAMECDEKSVVGAYCSDTIFEDSTFVTVEGPPTQEELRDENLVNIVQETCSDHVSKHSFCTMKLFLFLLCS